MSFSKGLKRSLRDALRHVAMQNPFQWLPASLLARLLLASGLFDWTWYASKLNYCKAASVLKISLVKVSLSS